MQLRKTHRDEGGQRPACGCSGRYLQSEEQETDNETDHAVAFLHFTAHQGTTRFESYLPEARPATASRARRTRALAGSAMLTKSGRRYQDRHHNSVMDDSRDKAELL